MYIVRNKRKRLITSNSGDRVSERQTLFLQQSDKLNNYIDNHIINIISK